MRIPPELKECKREVSFFFKLILSLSCLHCTLHGCKGKNRNKDVNISEANRTTEIFFYQNGPLGNVLVLHTDH